MHLAKEREVGEVLGIPPTVTQAALFPVAYTIGTDFRPAVRPPRRRSRSGTPGEKTDERLREEARKLMQSYTVRFHVDAPPTAGVAGTASAGAAELPETPGLKWPTGSMEILHEGDEAGEGLVRTCVFALPKWLLSGGKGRSFETVTEAKLQQDLAVRRRRRAVVVARRGLSRTRGTARRHNGAHLPRDVLTPITRWRAFSLSAPCTPRFLATTWIPTSTPSVMPARSPA